MKKTFNAAFFLFLLLFITSQISYAADTLAKKYPEAVLVQLRSEHNRIEALTKARMYREVEEVKNDAQEVTKRMKLDFHDHFDYCVVYYYMDTNADLVQKKQFDGILMREDGSPVLHPVINSNSTDYVIAYYGYPISQSRLDRVQTDTSRYSYDPQATTGRGLVILNDKFLQLTYFYKFGYDDEFFGRRKRARPYIFSSKHFEMEYYPFAGLFNRTMLNPYGRRRIEE